MVTLNTAELAPIPDLPMPDWEALAAIPIVDNGEPLVPCSLSDGRLRVYPAYYQMGVPGALPECHVREGIYERLLAAGEALPEGVHLVVLDGWRPFAVQQYLFDTFTDLLAKQQPALSAPALLARVRELISPPSCDERCPSPHLTGGAVDVTLCDAAGRLLPMGSCFDEATPRARSAWFEGRHDLSRDEFMMRDHRRLLYGAMAAAGFRNLPSEWWHYDCGDQLESWYAGTERACYGVTRVQSLAHLWSAQLGLEPPG